MKNKQDLSRRNFIRNSVMAGGAVQREIKVSFSYLLFLSYSFDAKVKAKPRNVFAARLNLFCQEVHYLFS